MTAHNNLSSPWDDNCYYILNPSKYESQAWFQLGSAYDTWNLGLSELAFKLTNVQKK